MSAFPCTGCGACCRRLFLVPRHLVQAAGLSTDSSGACAHLTAENRCAIYNERPDICRVEKYLGILGIDRAAGFRDNAARCNQFMDEDRSPFPRVVV